MSVRPFNDSNMILNGTPVKLGAVVATTTKNNHDTAVPFNNTGNALKGKVLLLHASAACNVNFAGADNTATASATATDTTYGVPLSANERVTVSIHNDYGWIAVVGSATVTVWELK